MHGVGLFFNNREDFKMIKPMVNGDGTVTDSATQLMWKQEQEPAQMSWNDAMALKIDFAGYSDWRLPTINELNSIVEYSRTNPAIETAYFPNTTNDWFWSSSPYAYSSYYAWIVHFGYGYDGNGSKKSRYAVRLVRGGLHG